MPSYGAWEHGAGTDPRKVSATSILTLGHFNELVIGNGRWRASAHAVNKRGHAGLLPFVLADDRRWLLKARPAKALQRRLKLSSLQHRVAGKGLYALVYRCVSVALSCKLLFLSQKYE